LPQPQGFSSLRSAQLKSAVYNAPSRWVEQGFVVAQQHGASQQLL